MNTEPKPTLPDPRSLPEGVKLRTRRFGTNPVSPLISVPDSRNQSDSSAVPPAFAIGWEDPGQGLKVTVRANGSGRLIAEVFAADQALLNKGALSVGLVGTIEGGLIRKTIPLTASEANGCSGSADFGPLASAVQELGGRIGIVAFLLV
jgi:hypothetical protein